MHLYASTCFLITVFMLFFQLGASARLFSFPTNPVRCNNDSLSNWTPFKKTVKTLNIAVRGSRLINIFIEEVGHKEYALHIHKLFIRFIRQQGIKCVHQFITSTRILSKAPINHTIKRNDFIMWTWWKQSRDLKKKKQTPPTILWSNLRELKGKLKEQAERYIFK